MSNTGRKLFYTLPPSLRFLVRRLYYLPIDTLEYITGKRDSLTPPRGLVYTGGGDFRKIGEMQLGYFRQFCSLQPDHAVLDIGSGMGRSAIPLTRFLHQNGRYEGFDVVKRGINWCKKNISSRYPNFNFTYIPLNNDLYRSDGTAPQSLRFPYEDGQFDLIIVNSVFTHMVASEVEHYFSEMSRVLKKGGYAYTTFFLYNSGQQSFPPGFNFPYDCGNYRLMDDKVKSANVAYEKGYLQEALVKKNKFELKHLFDGTWKKSDKEGCKEFQDLVIIKKT